MEALEALFELHFPSEVFPFGAFLISFMSGALFTALVEMVFTIFESRKEIREFFRERRERKDK